MKRICLALTCIATIIMMMACGGKKDGGDAASDESGNTVSSLAAGKWPTAVYAQYGIDELQTKGKIVFTDFADDDAYQYRVYYKGVTREEMLAWVDKLKAKGFRLTEMNDEKLRNKSYEYDIMLYQPEEKKDMRLRLNFDFKQNMEFEYYGEEADPAFEIVTHEGDDERQFVEYNFEVSLNPIDNIAKTEGESKTLGLTAADFAGIPNVRVVKMNDSERMPNMDIVFYADHLLGEADVTALHEKVADVLQAKGAKFSHAFSGKELTAEQLKADKVRSYNVELNGKKFLMTFHSDADLKFFGGSMKFVFSLNNK